MVFVVQTGRNQSFMGRPREYFWVMTGDLIRLLIMLKMRSRNMLVLSVVGERRIL